MSCCVHNSKSAVRLSFLRFIIDNEQNQPTDSPAKYLFLTLQITLESIIVKKTTKLNRRDGSSVAFYVLIFSISKRILRLTKRKI